MYEYKFVLDVTTNKAIDIGRAVKFSGYRSKEYERTVKELVDQLLTGYAELRLTKVVKFKRRAGACLSDHPLPGGAGDPLWE